MVKARGSTCEYGTAVKSRQEQGASTFTHPGWVKAEHTHKREIAPAGLVDLDLGYHLAERGHFDLRRDYRVPQSSWRTHQVFAEVKEY